MLVKDKVAIVTGGAGNIGRETALRFAREGAKVVVADIKTEAINKVVDEIKALNHQAIGIKVDVTKLDETKQMASTALDTFGQIDILAHLAGGSIPDKVGPFAEEEADTWDRIINLNIRGTFNCCRSVINHMIERCYGKIVLIGSCAGVSGQAGTADYSATKAGVIMFTRALAKEVGKYSINVNCISPGPIPGERVSSAPKDWFQRTLNAVYLGRPGRPEEVANVVVFLASDETSFVHGANWTVDGGVTLGYGY